jgi:hypothetical protein
VERQQVPDGSKKRPNVICFRDESQVIGRLYLRDRKDIAVAAVLEALRYLLDEMDV